MFIIDVSLDHEPCLPVRADTGFSAGEGQSVQPRAVDAVVAATVDFVASSHQLVCDPLWLEQRRGIADVWSPSVSAVEDLLR